MEEKKQINFEEKEMNPSSGWGMLFLSLILYLASIGAFIAGGKAVSDGDDGFAAVIFILASLIIVLAILIDCGLRVIKPNEALVLTLFGKYSGSIKKDGFFFVNPFSTSVNPAYTKHLNDLNQKVKNGEIKVAVSSVDKKLSLKAMTLRNEKQKINDEHNHAEILPCFPLVYEGYIVLHNVHFFVHIQKVLFLNSIRYKYKNVSGMVRCL